MSYNLHQTSFLGKPIRPSSQRGGYQITPGTAFIPQDINDQSQQPTLQNVSPSTAPITEYEEYGALQRPHDFGDEINEQEQRMSTCRQQRRAEATDGSLRQQHEPPPTYTQLKNLRGITEDGPYRHISNDNEYYHDSVAQVRSSDDRDFVMNDLGCDAPLHTSWHETNHGKNNHPYKVLNIASQGHKPNQDSFSSSTALATAAAVPATISEGFLSHTNFIDYPGSLPSQSSDMIADTAYSNYPASRSNNGRAALGAIDPTDIEDDEDDTFEMPKQRKRKFNKLAGTAATTAASTGVLADGTSKFMRGVETHDNSAAYSAVPGGLEAKSEKASEWLDQQTKGNKRLKWMVAGLIIAVIVLAVAGGVAGGVINSKKASSSTSSNSGLNKDSPAVQALLNNPSLHQVFPGIDYTPLNTQYPACLTVPASQDNITQDIAILSQLTPTVRLYGTDCNQTEMVLQAMKALDVTDSMKIWLGVWLENNQTTNSRQLDQMYSILSQYSTSSFAGIIIGNEVLFRKDMTEEELISTLNNARTKLKSQNIELPLATSDLGSSWTTSLVEAVDVVMSNVHPFFGGVPAPQAASWTWSYWQNNDVYLTKGMTNKISLIAETGWPSGGGNDCGTTTQCTSSAAGSVAGIDEMNEFLEGWVCDAMLNSTQYFWFEAFDEPWKVMYNTPTEQWEDKWGLLDVNRNLKEGLKIPDCGGRTANLGSS